MIYDVCEKNVWFSIFWKYPVHYAFGVCAKHFETSTTNNLTFTNRFVRCDVIWSVIWLGPYVRSQDSEATSLYVHSHSQDSEMTLYVLSHDSEMTSYVLIQDSKNT